MTARQFRDRQAPPVSRRATALILTVAAHLLILLILLRLGPDFTTVPKSDRALSTFSLLPEPSATRVEAPKARAVAKAKAAAARPTASSAAVSSANAPRAAMPVPKAAAPITPIPTLFGDKSLFAAGDISALPSHDDEGGSAKGGAGHDSVAAYGPGEGPGGQRLYRAEWYREPTHAELVTYLPNAPQGAWAEIACRTIADYRVENCRSLGESPLGSGLARGLREAAWQFRVLPPRIGGKAMIGTWVRIHFDFTRDSAG